MPTKLARLIIFIAGFALLAVGSRVLYIRYHHRLSPAGGVKVTGEGEVDEREINPYLRGGRDGRRRSATPEISVPPAPTLRLPKLLFKTHDLSMGVVGEKYRQVLVVAGAVGELIWEVKKGELPPGLGLDKGEISGQPFREGEWRFTITVEDGAGRRAARDFRLVIRKTAPSPEEVPLTIVTSSLPPAELGWDYLQEIGVEGGEPPYSWSLTAGALPNLILLNKKEGVLYGIPRETGMFRFTIRVADAGGEWTEVNYELTVRETTIEIITDALPAAAPGFEYSLQFQGRGGLLPYCWEMVSGALPPGLQFDPERGIIQGVCERWGTWTFLICLKDSRGRRTEKEFSLRVRSAMFGGSDSDQLRITTAFLPPATRGQLYSHPIQAEGGALPYVWTVSWGSLPPHLALDSDSGEVRGVAEKEGNYPFRVLVSDREGATAEAQYTLMVNMQLVYITTGSLEVGVVGEVYRQQLETTGGAPPYIWSLESGSLPRNLSLHSSTGLIEGFITELVGEEGSKEFVFRVKVVDQEENYDIAEFRLQVRSAPLPTPTLVITPASTPKLSPTPRSSITPAQSTPFPTPSSPSLVQAVSNFIAASSDGKIGLAWTNPDNEDFQQCEIRRKIGSPPRGPQDGTGVYNGIGDNLVDENNLTNGVTYFYAAIAYDQDGNASQLVYPFNDQSAGFVPKAVGLFAENDPFADDAILNALSSGGFGSQNMPGIVLGPPKGEGNDQGSLNVVSLHARVNTDGGNSPPYGGSITVMFTDNIVVNGTGNDFIIFENVFYIGGDEARRWMEPAVVSVSQNGITYYQFPYDYSPRYYDDGSVNFHNPYSYQEGFAGINPVYSNNGSPDPRNPAVSGGDSFDLSDIGSKNLTWIRYIKIRSTGDNWLEDKDGYSYWKIENGQIIWFHHPGDYVRHTQELGACSGGGSSGFDLDAVCAIHY